MSREPHSMSWGRVGTLELSGSRGVALLAALPGGVGQAEGGQGGSPRLPS